jgi:nucleoside-diphosphate-sugar epimerase
MTSSFGAVLDMGRDINMPWTYSAEDWNPITYAEAADLTATPQDAYRGSKTLAEQEAWRFVNGENPSFDLVTLCPSMVFGPMAHPVSSRANLNESNALLWKVASSVRPLPPARFNFWIDVRDLAELHVQSLLTPEAGGRRYVPVAPEKFNYQIADEIMARNFPERMSSRISEEEDINTVVNVNREATLKDFHISYRTFEETVVDFLNQAYKLNK